MTMTGMDLSAVPDGGPAAEATGSAADTAAELVRGPRADRPGRRAFTLAYKLRMLTEYDATVPGLKGEMLRREGCIPRTWLSGAARRTDRRVEHLVAERKLLVKGRRHG